MIEDAPQYRVEARDEKYAVVTADDTVVLECRDAPSAQHYAEMLNRAWQRGYKAGYRHGKAAAG